MTKDKIPIFRKIRAHEMVVFVFFLSFLIIGLNIYEDYGLSWDESIQHNIGIMNYNYIVTRNPSILLNSIDRYHGPIFELFLFVIEKNLLLVDIREIYLMRHLITFLIFFLSVFFFYLICKDTFRDWKIGLTGALFLILSPRIFADAFYNSKDLIFLSIFIISIYTLMKFHKKKSNSMAIIHAFICAILIDIRVIGIIVPMISILLIFIDTIFLKCKVNIKSIIIFVTLLIGFTILFWPILWEGPLYHFAGALTHMSKYPWNGWNLYLGNYVKSDNLPWHYIPVWIVITTPILYLLFFAIGILILFKSFFSDALNFYSKQKEYVIFLLWIFVPIITVIALRPVLYDGWRHMFFIYPALLLVSIYGMVSIFNIINKLRIYDKRFDIAKLIFILIITFALSNVIFTMIKYHPYQNVYFNMLAGKNMEEIKNNFEMDYWGLSYREGLEYILENDKRELIVLYVAGYPGILNSEILTVQDRMRIKYTKQLNDADYFLSNYRWHKDEYPYQNEYFSIRIDNAKILTVYKLK